MFSGLAGVLGDSSFLLDEQEVNNEIVKIIAIDKCRCFIYKRLLGIIVQRYLLYNT